MEKTKKCKVCNETFVAKRDNQQFCKRKCFRQDYSRRTREANAVKRFPSYKCVSCKKNIELDFSPARDQKRWKGWACPECGLTNEDALEKNVNERGIDSFGWV